jgi:uncharacterized membrane protein
MSGLVLYSAAMLQESVRGVVAGPGETAFEPTVVNFVSWLKLIVEMTGAVIIAIGFALAFIGFIRVLIASEPENYNKIRLLLARYLALALEFQLGADILSTAISPSWDQIGKLGAIAVIRTALNYFLTVEMREERKLSETEAHVREAAEPG